MQVDVKNIDYIMQTISILNGFIEKIEIQANEKINFITKSAEEIVQELNFSNNLLSTAKVQEAHKFSILAQRNVELASALQKEVAAIASANPIAIVAASANVAKKTHEAYVANQKHQRAKKNRINMEKRVELVNKAKFQNERLLEETKNIFKANILNINNLKTQVALRLQNAFQRLSEYFSNNEYLNGLDVVTPHNLKDMLQLDSKKAKEFFNYLYVTDKNFKAQVDKLKQEYKNAKTDFEREKVLRKIRQNLSGSYTEKFLEQSLKSLGDVKTQHSEPVGDTYSKVDILLENVNKPIILGKGKCKHVKEDGSLAIEIKTGAKEYLLSQKEHLKFQIEAHKKSADASVIITTKDIYDLRNEEEFRDIFKEECSSILAILPKKMEIDQNIIDAMELK